MMRKKGLRAGFSVLLLALPGNVGPTWDHETSEKVHGKVSSLTISQPEEEREPILSSAPLGTQGPDISEELSEKRRSDLLITTLIVLLCIVCFGEIIFLIRQPNYLNGLDD